MGGSGTRMPAGCGRERGFRRLLGGGGAVEVQVQVQDSIVRPPSGKRRVVVSRVADERFRALVGTAGGPR